MTDAAQDILFAGHGQDWRRRLNSMPCLMASIVAGAVGSLMFLVTPIFLGALSDSGVYSPRQAGIIGSADLAGMFAGSVALSLWIRNLNWRRLAVVALSLFLASQLMSIMAKNIFYALFVMRFLSGAAGIALMSVAFSHIADTSRHDRNFAIFIVAQMLTGALATFLIPYFINWWGMNGLFYFLLLAGAPIFLVALFIPEHGKLPAGDQLSDARHGPLSWAHYAMLFGIFLFGLGVMLVWAYVERIGTFNGYSPTAIGKIISWSLLASICGALSVTFLQDRFGRMRLIFAATLCIIISMYALTAFPEAIIFMAAVSVFAFCWTFAAPYQLAILAQSDATGKTIVLALAMMKVGYALAPGAGGFISMPGDYDHNVMLGAVCVLGSFLLLLTGAKAQQKSATIGSPAS